MVDSNETREYKDFSIILSTLKLKQDRNQIKMGSYSHLKGQYTL